MGRTEREFLELLCSQGSFEAKEDAQQWVEAALSTLGTQLTDDELHALEHRLPEEIARPLFDAQRGPRLSEEEFFRNVAKLTDASVGQAAEHTEVVFHAVSDYIGAELCTRMQQHLPQLSSLFEPFKSSPVHAPPAPHIINAPPAQGHTLADGRAGSQHPLSEARPETAHSESVVRSDNPHEDTKLSSSHGLTQEREGESLATGKPGSRHPLSGS